MKIVYWLLPILVTHFQFVPFVLSGLIIFLTPLKNTIAVDQTSEIYMFWFFYLLFALPAMNLSSYIYQSILWLKRFDQYRKHISIAFIALWCLVFLIILAKNGYLSFVNAIAAVVISLFYLVPLVVAANFVMQNIRQQEIDNQSASE